MDTGPERVIGAGSLLVTGGNGFIGRRVSQMAAVQGYRVTALSRTAEAARRCGAGEIESLACDLSDANSLRATLGTRAFDYVVNCAGYVDHTPYRSGGRRQIETHLVGLMNLLDCLPLDRLSGFVQVGSSDEYGGAPAPQREDAREAPISPYSMAKTAATQLVQMLYRTEGFPGSVVRLFLVYGPGQGPSRFLPQVISGCLSGAPFPVSAGEQIRDFCYVDDVAAGILKTLTTAAARGQVINLGSGEPMRIREVIEQTVRQVGRGEPRYGELPYRPGENMALYPDLSRARLLLDWSPSTNFSAGLARTISWLRKSPCDTATFVHG